MKKRLIIVDVSNFIFRAFYAIRPMLAPDGTPTNAVHGILSMFLKLFGDYQPTHIILARDTAGGSFRNELYPEYKANRGAPPEDLVPQFSLIDELFNKMQLPSISNDKYEADDIIGTAVVKFKDEFDEILIASGDKDLMQFVDNKVKMLDTMKDKLYGPDEVFEKMGVYPEQIVDYLSILGDSSDNIPGIKGIGAKGAAGLLAEYKTLEAILADKENVKNKRAQKALITDGGASTLSKKLVTIVTDIDLKKGIDDIVFHFNPSDELIDYLKGLGFRTAIDRLLTLKQIEAQDRSSPKEKEEIVVGEYQDVKLEPEWKKYFELIKKEKQVSIVPFWADETKHFGTLLYLSLGFSNKEPILISFGSLLRPENILNDLFSLDDIEVIGHELKNFLCFSIVQAKKIPNKLFDVSQAHFVADPSVRHDWKTLCSQYLDKEVNEIDSSRGGNLFELDDEIRAFLVESAKDMLKIADTLKEEVKELGSEKALYELDLPLLPILAKMEMQGVNLDSEFYYFLEAQYTQDLEEIQKQIDEAGGEGINLRSPKQLRVLLFETLQLPIIKKTKTGPSTDSSVLTELAHQGQSEIPALILQYREIDKLLGTYVKTLPKLVNPVTKKIHTTFHLNNAATGRLSSDNPNLQNIPMRTERGRLLRKGFIPTEGHKFLSADYSQMELRILAHCSNDETMIQAFKEERDIHKQTASEVAGKDFDKVTKEERNQAKAVNFGLMYGQSSFGLSEQLGISRSEAKAYIDKYFTRFSKVKSFLDSLKEKCEKTGYAETLFGRKRVLKDINSNNRTVKSMAERIAVNSPIQGTASDIIKLAMIDIDQKILKQNLKSKMILQIHDELVFEVARGEEEELQSIVVNSMESAIALRVPMKVDSGFGENWFDLK